MREVGIDLEVEVRGLSRSRARGRGHRAGQRMCNKQNFLYCFIQCCWPSLPAAGPCTSLTHPSDSFTGMDTCGYMDEAAAIWYFN